MGYTYTTHAAALAMLGKRAKLLRDICTFSGGTVPAGTIVVIDCFDEHPNTRGFGFTLNGIRRIECGFDFDFNLEEN